MIYAADKAKFDALTDKALASVEAVGSEKILAAYSSEYSVRNRVAVIPVRGILLKEDDFWTRLMGGTSYVSLKTQIRSASNDNDVSGIVLTIDSPGGVVDGIYELGETIRNASKPIVAFVDGIAASAAYWIASQAKHIVSTKTSEVGSIGVYNYAYDFSKNLKDEGVETFIATTGELKGAGVHGTELTEAHKTEIKKHVDESFGYFKEAVALGRGMESASVDVVATGAMFISDEALGLKLIDEVGGIGEAFAAANRLTKNKKVGALGAARIKRARARIG